MVAPLLMDSSSGWACTSSRRWSWRWMFSGMVPSLGAGATQPERLLQGGDPLPAEVPGERRPDVAEVPALVGVAGDRPAAGRVAHDEAEAVRVAAQPPRLVRPGEAGCDVARA